MALTAGTKAPPITGLLDDGSKFSLESARGRPVVLYFYPKDFTPGCTREACSFRDAHGDLVGVHDARVIGVSRDSPASHARFKREYNLPFELLSDEGGAIAKAFGATYLGGLVPLTKRMTFVIDAEGIIRGVFHHELAINSHLTDVRACLEALPRAGGGAAGSAARA